MIRIGRNATKKLVVIFAGAYNIKSHTLDNCFIGEACQPGSWLASDYERFDGKLRYKGNGHYCIRYHSNHWLEFDSIPYEEIQKTPCKLAGISPDEKNKEAIMKANIQKAIEAWQKRERLIAERDAFDDQSSTRKEKIRSRYRERIGRLEQRERNARYELERRITQARAELTLQIENEAEAISEVQRIKEILQLTETLTDKPAPTWDDAQIKVPFDGEVTPWGVLYKDRYMQIRLYVYKNDKPKNRYTLAAYGVTLLPASSWQGDNPLILAPCDYGVKLYASETGLRFNVATIVKDAPTLEDLKAYYSKHKDKILKDFLQEHQELINEIEQIWSDYTLEDLEPFTLVACEE